jgi:hypothetical protein
MASGQTLAIWSPQSNEPPVTAGAYYSQRNAHLVLVFDNTVNWSAVFPGVLPRNYEGGGLTLRLCWMAATTDTGTVKWNAQIERNQTGVDNLNSDSFAAARTATGTAPATSGILEYTEIVFTSGAQMDSLAAGESFRLKITRDAVDAGDTMADLAQLHRVELRET